MWTYITLPVLLAQAERVDRLPDAGGLRRLRIKLPRTIAGHGSDQTLHIGRDGLICRHDYTATAFGGWARAAQVITSYQPFDGVSIGTARRVTPRLGWPLPIPTLVWILSNRCGSFTLEPRCPAGVRNIAEPADASSRFACDEMDASGCPRVFHRSNDARPMDGRASRTYR